MHMRMSEQNDKQDEDKADAGANTDAGTVPEQEQVTNKPPSATTCIASRFMSR